VSALRSIGAFQAGRELAEVRKLRPTQKEGDHLRISMNYSNYFAFWEFLLEIFGVSFRVLSSLQMHHIRTSFLLYSKMMKNDEK
jgi:hypothetical protein